jgi:hypothetical protein
VKKQLKCPGCTQTFEVWPSSEQKYCTTTCKHNHRTFSCNCKHCNKELRLKRSYKQTKNGFYYCSKKCRIADSTIQVTCQCGKKFNRWKAHATRSTYQYCSRKCYNNHKVFTSRSKNEVLLFEKLKEIFPTAKSNFRLKTYEADIVINDFKFAIHWNGIHHYKPIYGIEYLQRIQERDKKRYLAYQEAGFQNYIIKDLGPHSPKKVQSEFNNLLKQLASQA